MAYVLALFGILALVFGGYWAISALRIMSASTIADDVAIGYFVASAPGWSLIAFGLICLAGCEALLHLAAINRRSRLALEETEAMADSLHLLANGEGRQSGRKRETA